jgi:hypothetical protein
VASITAAEVSSWVGSLVARGLAPSTATRALATLRSILAFAVADARITSELDALKAELKRLRREVGRGVAMARIQADPGLGDDAPAFTREELAGRGE